MVSSAAETVEAFLEALPADRRAVIASVRDLVNRHLPPGYVETMNWGMISWEIPLARYPVTYNKQPLGYVALAAQKHYCVLYLLGVYVDSQNEKNLRDAYARAGRKLSLGKCCLRFKKLDDLLQAEVGEIIASTPVEACIAHYEASREKAMNRLRFGAGP